MYQCAAYIQILLKFDYISHPVETQVLWTWSVKWVVWSKMATKNFQCFRPGPSYPMGLGPRAPGGPRATSM